MAKRCPKCRTGTLDDVGDSCSSCGWRSRDSAKPQSDSRCGYAHHGERCPYPGVWSDSVAGESRWWCWWHASEEHRGHDATQDEFFSEYCTADRVREELERRVRSPLLERLRDDLFGHPEWHRQDGEPRSAYVERMRGSRREIWRKRGGVQKVTPT